MNLPNTSPEQQEEQELQAQSERVQQAQEFVGHLKSAKAQERFYLPAKAGLKSSYHLFDDTQITAIATAFKIGRPLLIKGDPGLGKSQIAHAIATAQGWNLLVQVVHSGTESTDLLYQEDHVQRLAQAQMLGALGNLRTQLPTTASSEASGLFQKQVQEKFQEQLKEHLTAIDHKNYVKPGPLWWAYHAKSALKFYETNEARYHSDLTQEIKPELPSVLLIDEIDKAEATLPNSLLEVLNNHSFHVDPQQTTIKAQENTLPFVVITSNDERALPHAFLRRCVVLELQLQKEQAGVDQLVQIANVHKQRFKAVSEEIIQLAAEKVIEVRESAYADQYKPGTSEYLDLLTALAQEDYSLLNEEARKTEQENALNLISQHILDKS